MNYPVLAYHKVSTQWELSFTMLYPKQFERQMRYLAKKGYIGKSLKEYLANPQDNYFVITFDDAYESVYKNAFPLLQELGFTASIFVICNYMGKNNTWDFTPGKIYSRHMDKESILKLHHAGWEIGSHGLDHLVITSMSSEEAMNDLQESKAILEDLVGEDVESFCFPFGNYTKEIVEKAKKAAYKNLVGYTERSRYGVIKRSSVYRLVDNKYSVLRKIQQGSSSMFFAHIKEAFFHSFSLLSRMKQKVSSKKNIDPDHL
ncbi:MAG: polysaccharide deacetylase family protein [Candidatus Neomarinimicrobiota bacterium]